MKYLIGYLSCGFLLYAFMVYHLQVNRTMVTTPNAKRVGLIVLFIWPLALGIFFVEAVKVLANETKGGR